MWSTVDNLLSNAIKTGCFPGCAIAAGQQGVVLYQKTFGYLTPSESVAVTCETRYDAGSLTQALATMPLALKAMENGLISPDDPISRFLPDAPQDKRDITLEQLLTHTAGLAASFSLEHEAHTAGEALSALLAHPLENQPGTKVRQSAMGYILLGFLMVVNSPACPAMPCRKRALPSSGYPAEGNVLSLVIRVGAMCSPEGR